MWNLRVQRKVEALAQEELKEEYAMLKVSKLGHAVLGRLRDKACLIRSVPARVCLNRKRTS